MEELEHLLLLCCYGGQPYLDFHPALRSARQLDPTEWVAEDIAGGLLENSTLSIPGREAVHSAGLLLSACDLYNVTFLTSSDQGLFHKLRADLACRCPPERLGEHCEFSAATAAAPQKLIQSVSNMPPMALVVAVIALALLILAFMMFRGCWCDCFGPLSMSANRRRDDAYDKPLSPEDVEKCLQRVRAYQARRDMELEPGRPLIPTVSGLPNISGGAAPYDVFVPPPPSAPPVRCSSPPPAYSSVAGSHERIASLH